MQCNSKTNWHENMGINTGKKKKKFRVQTSIHSKGFNFVIYIMMDFLKK